MLRIGQPGAAAPAVSGGMISHFRGELGVTVLVVDQLVVDLSDALGNTRSG